MTTSRKLIPLLVIPLLLFSACSRQRTAANEWGWLVR